MDIEFREIAISDRDWLTEKFKQDDKNACEYTFANNFIWRKAYHVEVAELCGCAQLRFRNGTQRVYCYPVGDGDKRAALEALMEICREDGCPLVLSPLLAADRAELLDWFPGEFLLTANRDSFDYVYSREKLATLAGKKLHGKRNHIAHFLDGGDWSYEPMTAENMEACRAMTYEWMRMREEKWNDEMEQEVTALHEAFDYREELGLVGGVLRREGEIVAFTIGEPLNTNTFVVHFEKAFPDMQGAYPMINQQFVTNACGGYEYVNREEDTGDPGLRKAKLSYYPEILLKKYVATQSGVVFADRERDGAQIVKIWQECFGDTDEEILYYLDHRMTEDNMLVIYRDGRAVSMASFLPCEYLVANDGGRGILPDAKAFVKQSGMYDVQAGSGQRAMDDGLAGSEQRAVNSGQVVNGDYSNGEDDVRDARIIPALYVYAVATLPEYRNQGLAREILSFARQHFKKPLVLSPADEGLCRYYGKMGFKKAFASGVENEKAAQKLSPDAISSKAATGFALGFATPEEYAAIRDAYFMRKFATCGYLRWDVDAVRFALDFTAVCGGGAYVVTTSPNMAGTQSEARGGAADVKESLGRERETQALLQGDAADAEDEHVDEADARRDILLYTIDGDTLIVRETTLADADLDAASLLLLAETGKKKVIYRHHGEPGMIWMPEAGGDVLRDEEVGAPIMGYLNLTLG